MHTYTVPEEYLKNLEAELAELKTRIESTINFVHNMGGIAQLKDCCRVVCTDVEALLKGKEE